MDNFNIDYIDTQINHCLQKTTEPKEEVIDLSHLKVDIHNGILNEIKGILLEHTNKGTISTSNKNYNNNTPQIDIYVCNEVKDPVLHTKISSVITLLFNSSKEVDFIYNDIEKYYDNLWNEVKSVLKNVFVEMTQHIKKDKNET